MENQMRLQGIGMVQGTAAGEIKVGDVLRWNFGGISRVTAIEFTKTGKTIICQVECMNRKGEIETYERKMRTNRLVNIIGSGNTVLKSEYSFEIVEEVAAPVEEVAAVEETAAVEEQHIIKAEIIQANYGEVKPLNTLIEESKIAMKMILDEMEKPKAAKQVNETLFRAIYSKNNDKVTIAYGSKKVMGIGNVSKNYDIEGRNGMQIAEIVFKANKEGSISVVKDFIL